MINAGPELYHWQISLPIFRQPLILGQLALAIGLPFGLVILIILITSGKSIYTLYALALIFLLFLLTYFLLLALNKGKYNVEFILNKKGLLCRSQSKQAKKNRFVNRLTVIMGVFTGKPTVAGAGLLAQAKEEDFLAWQKIQKIKYKPKSQTILLRGHPGQKIAVFCPPDYYQQIEDFIKEHVKSKPNRE